MNVSISFGNTNNNKPCYTAAAGRVEPKYLLVSNSHLLAGEHGEWCLCLQVARAMHSRMYMVEMCYRVLSGSSSQC